jgi:molybdenum transport protein
LALQQGDFAVSSVELARLCRMTDNDVSSRTRRMSRSAAFQSVPPQTAIIPAPTHSSGSVIPHSPAPTVASRAELEQLLLDDVPFGDLTTEALGIGAMAGSMQLTVRDKMVLALAEDAAAILALAGCKVDLCASSGTVLEPGSPILTAQGSASALLRSWKVAQTLIETWSGVATSARAILDAGRAVAPQIAVACTRKNIPGTKRFAVAAVKAGGAVMHRLGLSETVLVFPEHRAFLGGVPLTECVAQLRRAAPEKRLVVEVTSFEAAIEAAVAGFDVIQAEKFTPAEIAALVARMKAMASVWNRPVVAAAGGINAENVAAYARAGADVVVTSSPYLARPRDVQVRIEPP